MEKCKIAHFCTSSEPHLQIRGVQAPEDGATSAAGGGGVRVGGGVVGGGSRFRARGGRVGTGEDWGFGGEEETNREGSICKGRWARAREGGPKGKGARRGAQNVSRGRRFQEFFVS